jgi:hypothetical protein
VAATVVISIVAATVVISIVAATVVISIVAAIVVCMQYTDQVNTASAVLLQGHLASLTSTVDSLQQSVADMAAPSSTLLASLDQAYGDADATKQGAATTGVSVAYTVRKTCWFSRQCGSICHSTAAVFTACDSNVWFRKHAKATWYCVLCCYLMHVGTLAGLAVTVSAGQPPDGSGSPAVCQPATDVTELGKAVDINHGNDHRRNNGGAAAAGKVCTASLNA